MSAGRLLIAAGLLLICLGVLVLGLDKIGIAIGRLPGDVVLRGKRTTVYFPVVTCLLLSSVATLVFWFAGKMR